VTLLEAGEKIGFGERRRHAASLEHSLQYSRIRQQRRRCYDGPSRRSQHREEAMEFKKVESLRRAKLEKREAAAEAAPPPAQASYSLFQKILWCAVQALRHAWLNVYPLLALVVGVAFIVFVKQTREILANLEQEWLFVGVLAAWAVSIWYSMRVLSSTDFPGDVEPHPAATGCTGWLNGESPRMAAFAGLAIIACASSIFLAEKPTPNWFAVLAAGIVPVTWAAARLGDRIAGLWRPLEQKPVYRWSVLLIAVAAAAIASYSWSSVPQPMRRAPEPLHLEDWLLGICVALTLAPIALRRRGAAAHWAMAGALGVWLWVVFKTAGNHPGPTLPFLILALAALGLWFTERRRELLSIRNDAATPHYEVRAGTFAALGVAFALQVALVVALTVSAIAIGMRLGTLAILFLALALLAWCRSSGACSSGTRPTTRCATRSSRRKRPSGRAWRSTSSNGARSSRSAMTVRSSSSAPPAAGCAPRTGPRPCSPPPTTRPAANSGAMSMPTRACRAARSASPPISRSGRCGRRSRPPSAASPAAAQRWRGCWAVTSSRRWRGRCSSPR